MGNTTQAAVKEQTEEKVNVKSLEANPGGEEVHKKFQLPDLNRFKSKKCDERCFLSLKIVFTVFAALTCFKATGLIIMVVLTSVANRVFSVGQSGRMVAAVILAFTAAVAVSLIIYAVFGVYKKHKKPLYAASLVLLVMIIIQAVIAGTAVNMTAEDERHLSKSLQDTFASSRVASSRQHLIWSSVQNTLHCCGLQGAEDYRVPTIPPYFPPNVPISCCPSYDSNRSELVQEREREGCKAKRDFFDVGCRDLVIEGVKNAAHLLLTITVGLIVLEVVLTTLSIILYSKLKKYEKEQVAPES